jgi:hypothetical protein
MQCRLMIIQGVCKDRPRWTDFLYKGDVRKMGTETRELCRQMVKADPGS